MTISKNKIDNLIDNFLKRKDSITFDPKHLTKFKNGNKDDELYLSFFEGKDGGEYYLKFLKHIIKECRPKTVIELGNREGLSTLAIYEALKELPQFAGNFYTIDIIKDQRYCPDQMFTDRSTHFLFGDVCSIDILEKIPFDIDFLFSDTIHYNFQIQDEFEIYQHFLSDTALIAVDDIHLNDKGIFFEGVTYDKWDLTKICHSSGWGLFLYKRKKPEPEDERYKKAVRVALTIWERKYNDKKIELDTLQKEKYISMIKSLLKKNKKFYKLYTSVYNNYLHKIKTRLVKKW